MIQVGKLRSFITDEGETKFYFTTKKTKFLQYESLKECFDNAEEDLKRVPENERYNLFYTVAHHEEGKRTKKSWQSQDIIPFDLDGIDLERINEYAPIVAEVCGFDLNKTAVVYSGNGVHILVWVESITDKDYIKDAKRAYGQLLDRIDKALSDKGLAYTKDSTTWDYARILRMPFTKNRKGSVEKDCILRHNGLEVQDWKLPAVEKVEKDKFIVKGSFPRPDSETITTECKFFNWLETKPEEVHEPHAYAMLSIAGHFPDDGAYAQSLYGRFSSPSINAKSYDEFLEQALRASGPRTCEGINDIWGKCQTCPHYNKITSPILIRSKDFIGTEHCGFTLKSLSGKTLIRQYGDLRRFYYKKHPYRYLPQAHALYKWQGTHYEEEHSDFLKVFAQKHFVPEAKESERVEFMKNVQSNNTAGLEFVEKKPEGKINFLNGVLNMNTNVLEKHTPEENFTYVLPYNYDPDAKCPTWDQFLKDITLEREDLAQVLEEFMGYCIYGGEYIHHKALILSGTGSNGKSTFIDVLKGLLGEKNYGTVALTSISSDKFAAAEIHNKLVNISEEEPPSCFRETGVFKNLTGNNTITAQKKFKDPFQMLSRAKIVITYNEPPAINDRTTGMRRRLLVVPFDLDLEGRHKDKKNERIKYALQEELPGILNKVLVAWKRLEARGRFEEPESVKQSVKDLMEGSSSFHMWAEEYLELTDNYEDFVKTKDAFFSYCSYMEESREPYPLGRKKFVQELKNYGLHVAVHRVGNKTQRGFRNAKLCNAFESGPKF